MKNKSVLIVDGNNLAHRSYHALKNSAAGLLKTSTGIPTSVFFGILQSLNVITEETTFDQIVIAWDVGGSIYRKQIFSAYKGNRVHTDLQDLYTEMEDTRNYFGKLNITQAAVKGIEADDVIGFLAKTLVKSGYSVTILSDDKDFFSLYSKSIRIWRPCKNSYVTRADIIEAFKVPPKFFTHLFALMGQEKDFIPGLCDIDMKNKKLIKCGFGVAKAAALLQPMIDGKKTFRQCVDAAIQDVNYRWRDNLKRNRRQVFASLKLMKIRTNETQYSPEELAKVKAISNTILGASKAPKTISKAKVEMLKTMLEIRKVPILAILKRTGMKIQ